MSSNRAHVRRIKRLLKDVHATLPVPQPAPVSGSTTSVAPRRRVHSSLVIQILQDLNEAVSDIPRGVRVLISNFLFRPPEVPLPPASAPSTPIPKPEVDPDDLMDVDQPSAPPTPSQGRALPARPPDHSLTNFVTLALKLARNTKLFVDARVSALQLMHSFIETLRREHNQTDCRRALEGLRGFCGEFFRRETKTSPRAMVVTLLCSVLGQDREEGEEESEGEDEEKMKIRTNRNRRISQSMALDSKWPPIKIFEVFFESHTTQKSKLGTSARGNLLRLFGLLAIKFSQELGTQSMERIRSALIGEIVTQEGKKVPEQGVIASTFAGLGPFLSAYCEEESDPSKVETKRERDDLIDEAEREEEEGEVDDDGDVVMGRGRRGVIGGEWSIASADVLARRNKFMNFRTRRSYGAPTSDARVVFNALEKSLNYRKATRHLMAKEALSLFATHARLLRPMYLAQPSIPQLPPGQARSIESLFWTLCERCCHNNPELRRAAWPALEAFLMEVVSFLEERFKLGSSTQNQMVKDEARGIFDLLWGKFTRLVAGSIGDDSNDVMELDGNGRGSAQQRVTDASKKYSKSVAIAAFGKFSRLYRTFNGESDLKRMLLELFEFAAIELNPSNIDESVYFASAFLTSFATIILSLDTIDLWIIDRLDDFIRIMMEQVLPKQYFFHRAKWKNFMAILHVLVAVYQKRKEFGILVMKIIQHSLDQSMTRVRLRGPVGVGGGGDDGGSGDEEDGSSNEEVVTLFDAYLHMWQFLLKKRNIIFVFGGSEASDGRRRGLRYPWCELPMFCGEMADASQEEFFQEMYDKLIGGVLTVMESFDLRARLASRYGDDDADDGDDESKMQVDSNAQQDQSKGNQVGDRHLLEAENPEDFIQFFELSKFALAFLRRAHPKWLRRWIFPLSTRLIAMSRSNPCHIQFFDLLTIVMKKADYLRIFREAMADREEAAARTECTEMISAFGLELIQRHGDLLMDVLVPVLYFILSVPLSIVRLDLEDYVSALRTSFRVGVMNLPLAWAALHSLEIWERGLPLSVLEETILPQVMPLLNEYLVAESTKEELGVVGVSLDQMKKRKKTRIQTEDFSKKKFMQQFVQKEMFSVRERADARKLQLKVVKLLGRFGGRNYAVLNKSLQGGDDASEIPKWDLRSPQVVYKLPLAEGPKIYFDRLLPRAAELAEQASDRLVQVAACEFLHSVIVYMIGRRATDPSRRVRDGATPSRFYHLYRTLFPVVIRLAISPESVARQLFRPLADQLVHWYTQNEKYENKETMALLDAIVTGLTNEDNMDLRDFCAELIGEFAKWTVKHTSTERDPFKNFHSLLSRLFGLTRHSDRYKRMGSMLAYNHLYREFREHDTLIKRYTFLWMKVVVSSLRFINIEDDEKSVFGTYRQTVVVVNHLKKIIRQRIDLLRTHETRGLSLEVLLKWIFERIGHPVKPLRRVCQKLFIDLAKMKMDADDGPKRFIASKMKVLNIVNQIEDFSATPRNSLATQVEAVLDAYFWLFDKKYITPNRIWPLSAILGKVVDLLRQEMTSKTCSVLVPIIRFTRLNLQSFSSTLQQTMSQNQSSNFLNEDFYLLIARAVLRPWKLGVDVNSKRESLILLQVVYELLKVMRERELDQEFLQYLRVGSRRREEDLLDEDYEPNGFPHYLDLFHPNLTLNQTWYLCEGCKAMLRAGMVAPSALDTAALAERLFAFARQPTPTEKAASKFKWELCLRFGVLPVDLLELLANSDTVTEKNTALSNDDDDQMDVDTSSGEEARSLETNEFRKGQIFYQLFCDSITEHIRVNFGAYAPLLIERSPNDPFFLKVLYNVFIGRRRDLDKAGLQLPLSYSETVVDPPNSTVVSSSREMVGLLCDFGPQIHNMYSETTFDRKLDIMKLLGAMCSVDFGGFVPSCEPLVDLIVQSCRSQKDGFGQSVEVKLLGLQLLPQIFRPNRGQLLELINDIVVYDFPIDYHEVPSSGRAFVDHTRLLSALFHLLVVLSDLDVFKAMLPFFRWRKHPMAPEMRKQLWLFLRHFVAKTDVMDYCVETLLNEQLPHSLRRSAIDWVANACLQTLTDEALANWYHKILPTLVQTSDCWISDVQTPSISQVITSIGCLTLIEGLFLHVPPDRLEAVAQGYPSELAGPDKKKMMSSVFVLMERCFKSEIPNSGTLTSEGHNYFLEFRQRSLNGICAFVKLTQAKDVIFQRVFSRAGLRDKRQRDYFEDIMPRKQFEFAVETKFEFHRDEFESLAKDFERFRKQRRRNASSSASLALSGTDAFGAFSSIPPTLGATAGPEAGVVMFDSIPASARVPDVSLGGVSMMESGAGDLLGEVDFLNSDAQNQDQEALELDLINQISSMRSIVEVIRTIWRNTCGSQPAWNFGTPQPGHVPRWMGPFLDRVGDRSATMNLRIFTVKVVLNCPEPFFAYRKLFLPYLLDIAMHAPIERPPDAEPNDRRPPGIHYFLRDVCILIIRWAEQSQKEGLPVQDLIPSRRGLATLFVNHLMKNAVSTSSSVLRANIRLIRLLLNLWGPALSVSRYTLTRWLGFPTNRGVGRSIVSASRLGGVHLLSATIATTGLKLFYTETTDARDARMTPSVLLTTLVDNLSFNSKRIYQPAAEVCGAMLLAFEKKSREHGSAIQALTNLEQEFRASLTQKLSLMIRQGGEIERFLNCLLSIGRNNRSIHRNFLDDIYTHLPRLFGQNKVSALKVICWCADSPGIYLELHPCLDQLLNVREEPTQVLTLTTLLKLVTTAESGFTDERISDFFRQVVKMDLFDRDILVEAGRMSFYRLLIAIHEQREQLANAADLRFLLLRGLSDPSHEIRRFLLEKFWHLPAQLDSTPHGRLTQLFSSLYSSKLKRQRWLNYATYLLLHLTSMHANYDSERELFDRAIENCVFDESMRSIDTAFSQSAPMPLFSQTLSDTSTLGSYRGSFQPSFAGSQLVRRRRRRRRRTGVRATQQRRWEETLGTMEGHIAFHTQPAHVESSLFVGFGALRRDPPSTQPRGAGEVPQEETFAGDAWLLRRFRRRLKSQGPSQDVMRISARRKKEKDQREARIRTMRKQRVELARRDYRTGELPDIEKITHRSILMPLETLCLMDGVIAQTTFRLLFDELFSVDRIDCVQTVQRTLNEMLTHSSDDRILVSLLFDLILNHEKLSEQLAFHAVSQASLDSSNLGKGCLVLEDLINRKKNSAILSSDDVIMTDFAETQLPSETVGLGGVGNDDVNGEEIPSSPRIRRNWFHAAYMELSKLYSFLENQDVVCAVFGHHTPKSQITLKGLRERAEAKFKEAAKTFEKAIHPSRVKRRDSSYPDTPQTQTQNTLDVEMFDADDESVPLAEQIDFWRRQKLSCLMYQGAWDQITEDSPVVEDVWQKSAFFVDSYLTSMLHFRLQVASQRGDGDRPPYTHRLAAFLRRSMTDQEREDQLLHSYPDVLACSALVDRDFSKARSFVRDGYEAFLREWCNFQILTESTQRSLLRNLQRLVEVEEFMNVMKKRNQPTQLLKLLATWNRRFPNLLVDDTIVWSRIVLTRRYALRQLEEYVRRHSARFLLRSDPDAMAVDQRQQRTQVLSGGMTQLLGADIATLNPTLDSSVALPEGLSELAIAPSTELGPNDFIERILMQQVRNCLMSCKAARLQGNHRAAVTLIRYARSTLLFGSEFDSLRNAKPRFELALIKVLRGCALGGLGPNSTQMESFRTVMKHMKNKIGGLTSDQDQAFLAPMLSVKARVHSDIYDLASMDGETSETSLRKSARKCWKAFAASLEHAVSGSREDGGDDRLARTHRKFALWVSQTLQNAKKIEHVQIASNPARFARTSVTACLKAIAHSPELALELFPIVLEFISSYEPSQRLFSRYIDDIPLRSLICWIPQLFSHLRDAEAVCILPLLQRFAKEHPRAVYYPFQMCYDDIKDQCYSEDIRGGLNGIRAMLSNAPLERFVHELEFLHSPDLRARDRMGPLTACFAKHDAQGFRRLWREFWINLVAKSIDGVPLGRGTTSLEFRRYLLDVVKVNDFSGGKNANLLVKMIESNRRRKRRPNMNEWDNFRKQIQFASANKKFNFDARSLSGYSEYLNNFADENESGRIVMPGQFLFLSPLDSNEDDESSNDFVMITSLKKSVITMKSMRRPKKVVFVGSDGKEYPFLAKGGEDLRQDQRIEHLFSLMNFVLKADAHTRRHDLSVRLYKVIPVSQLIGLVEWVEGCSTMNGIFEKGCAARGEQWNGREGLKTKNVQKWCARIPKFGKAWQKATWGSVDFHKLYYRRDSERVIEDMIGIWEGIPADVFKLGLVETCGSIEEFFGFRNTYGRSLSSVNICSYVLGIGDRHLDNYMIDNATGEIVPIDFGHAFETATEVLPIPELIPFRLTRQLLNVFLPLTKDPLQIHREYCAEHDLSAPHNPPPADLPTCGGVMLPHMVRVMKALRAKSSLLHSVMKIFIDEPLMDWEKHATNREKRREDIELERIQANSVIAVDPATVRDEDGDVEMEGEGEVVGDSVIPPTLIDDEEEPSALVDSRSVMFGNEEIILDEDLAYAARKIEHARARLNLYHPSILIGKSLRTNRSMRAKKIRASDAIVVTEGRRVMNRRRRGGGRSSDPEGWRVRFVTRENEDTGARILQERCESVEQQVEFLVDLATDPVILANTYAGWSPHW